MRLTKDGRLAVIHDATLDRVCGVSGRAAELTAAALSALRLEGTEERIPFLEEVAPLFAGRAPLIVELKTDWRSAGDLARRTVECLDRFSIDYCVESFDPRPLLWLRRRRPDVLRGQLSQNFHRHPSGQGLWNRLALTNLFYNVFTRPDFVAYRFEDQGQLRCACAAGGACGRPTGRSVPGQRWSWRSRRGRCPFLRHWTDQRRRPH